MGARQFIARDRPRCLLWNLPAHLDAALSRTLSETKVIGSLSQVYEPEWDLVIAWGQDIAGVATHLFVVAIGDGALTSPEDYRGGLIRTRSVYKGNGWVAPSVAQEFEIPDNIPPEFETLVSSDLVPMLKTEADHSGVIAAIDASKRISGVTRLLQGSDGVVLAAYFQRLGGRWCLSLPFGGDVVAWVTAAVNVWHGVDPKAFPGRMDWANVSLDWDPPDVLVASQRYREASNAFDAAQAAKEAAWQSYLDVKAKGAAGGPFQMLTASGDPLVAAVSTALVDMGFTVRQMDDEWPDGQRLEDLRVRVPESSDWEAVVEVKGYSRGTGKAGDLTNLVGRFAKRYRLSEHREPNALWYVVNHEPDVDPSARRPILDTSDGDVDAFAASDGLSIDTVDLYRLWRDVRQGRVAARDARQLITSSSGRLSHAWAASPPG